MNLDLEKKNRFYLRSIPFILRALFIKLIYFDEFLPKITCRFNIHFQVWSCLVSPSLVIAETKIQVFKHSSNVYIVHVFDMMYECMMCITPAMLVLPVAAVCL